MKCMTSVKMYLEKQQYYTKTVHKCIGTILPRPKIDKRPKEVSRVELLDFKNL